MPSETKNLDKTILNIFNSIQDEEVKIATINKLQLIADLSLVGDAKALQIALSNQNMTQFVGHHNAKYLAKFMKLIAITKNLSP